MCLNLNVCDDVDDVFVYLSVNDVVYDDDECEMLRLME